MIILDISQNGARYYCDAFFRITFGAPRLGKPEKGPNFVLVTPFIIVIKGLDSISQLIF